MYRSITDIRLYWIILYWLYNNCIPPIVVTISKLPHWYICAVFINPSVCITTLASNWVSSLLAVFIRLSLNIYIYINTRKRTTVLSLLIGQYYISNISSLHASPCNHLHKHQVYRPCIMYRYVLYHVQYIYVISICPL